jgi:hypothetical protein
MRTTQRKGDIAVTQAIASFTREGNDVSLPITESAAYDLIVDTAFGLKRVQVKYTSGKLVDLRNIHSNSKGYVIKTVEDNAYDWLYVFWANGDKDEEHLIPRCLSNRSTITLNRSTLFTVGLGRELGLIRD